MNPVAATGLHGDLDDEQWAALLALAERHGASLGVVLMITNPGRRDGPAFRTSNDRLNHDEAPAGTIGEMVTVRAQLNLDLGTAAR